MGKLRQFEDDLKNTGRKLDDEIFQPVKNTIEAIIEDPKKLAAVALAVAFPGAGAALGSALGLGTGVVAQVAGQALINATLNGGDVKAAVIGAVLPIAGKEIAGTLSTTLTNSEITGTLNKVITRAVTQGTTAAILGKDPLSAALLGGVTAGVNAIVPDIPGYNDLPQAAKNAVSSAIATKLTGGNVGAAITDSLITDAIDYAKNEVVTYQKRGDAIKSLSDAGVNFGEDYSSLSEEQKAVVDSIAKSKSQPVAIAQYKDSLYTDENEALEMARAVLGREPSEFELMEFIGIPESNTKSLLENIRYDESTFDSNELAETYKARYGVEPPKEFLESPEAFDMLGRSDAQAANLLNDYYVRDKNVTTFEEAQSIWERTGNTRPMTTDELAAIAGGNELTAELFAKHAYNLDDTIYNGRDFETVEEAAEGAKKVGMTEFFGPDGQIYKVLSPVESSDEPTPVKEANIRASIEEKKTFNEAFAAARKELGAGRTFTWNGKQYTTNVLPKDTFDASKSSTLTTAATLAHANGKDKFIGPDGKTYSLDSSAKSVLDNSVNQSEAETQRLLRQAIKPATNETTAETQRLMESGTRGTMDTIGAMTAQALGTTQRGFGQFLSNAGKTYAAMTGDLDFDNALIKIGKEVESYAQGNDIYGIDVQKNRLSQALARANETDNWIEKGKILGSAISKNSIGFFDVAGTEVVAEIPETVLQIGAALMTGGSSLGAMAAIGAAGSVMETFGSTVESTYKQAKKAGFSDSEAMNKAYLNGVLGTAIEAGTNFVADKALLAPFLNKFTNSLAGTATGFVSSTTIGAASELAAGLSQSYATQYTINPETASLSKAATDGIFEMFIGGTAQGTMGLPGYAIQGGAIIGKDYFGKDITMADVAAGAVLDSSTVNPNATIATSEDGDPVTLGGAMMQMPNYQFDMSTLKTYVPQVFNNDNLIVGQDELGNNVTFSDLMGQTTESKGFDAVYKNLLDITPEQRTEAKYDYVSSLFNATGYKPTEQEINQFINQAPLVRDIKEEELSAYTNPRMVDEQEVRDAYAELGLDEPTQADIDKLIGQYQQEELAGRAEENLGTAQFNVTTAKQEAAEKALQDLEVKTTEQYNALTAEQKALADALTAQGTTLSDAIAAAQDQTQQKIADLGAEVDARITELMQQGQTYQQATQNAFAEVNAKNQELSGLIGTQGRAADQSDIDALTEMLGGQRGVDLSYDVTGDKQITQADIDFLTGVVGGKNTDWTAPQQSPWAATGLYGQLAANEAKRQADLQAQLLREQEAAAAAAEDKRQGKIKGAKTNLEQARQDVGALRKQLPGLYETTSTPIYGTMDYFDPFGDPFGDPFATQKLKMASTTNPADQTKMAAGGYIDDLLAGDMTADDLLNLLR